jgi:peptide/nickel transport system permease protein
MSSQASAGAMALPPDNNLAAAGPAVIGGGGGDAPEAPPRSFARRVIDDTFSRAGARLGAIWVAALAFLGVFAPFLANSHPYLMKVDGRWSSPLLRHLTVADVVLLSVTFASVVLAFTPRLRLSAKVIVVAVVLVGSFMLSLKFVSPPVNVVYDRYRQLEREGKVESIWRAPVPFSPTDYLRDQPQQVRTPPSARHWFGVEGFGADVLSRMIHASRIALTIGFVATGIAVVIGVVIGGLMGYYVGLLDIIGMRLIEIFEAIPTLFLLITLVAVFSDHEWFRGSNRIYMMMVIIGLTSWTGDARFIRAEYLRLRKQDFVQAAIAAGIPRWSVIFKHMLPNGIAPVLVAASFGIASAILTESVLSFLGLGLIQEPSWGGMLNQARAVGGNFSWWIAVFPGGAIFLTVFAYNLIGEALRDALDPKLRKLD